VDKLKCWLVMEVVPSYVIQNVIFCKCFFVVFERGSFKNQRVNCCCQTLNICALSTTYLWPTLLLWMCVVHMYAHALRFHSSWKLIGNVMSEHAGLKFLFHVLQVWNCLKWYKHIHICLLVWMIMGMNHSENVNYSTFTLMYCFIITV
jgi:hypothetical protein